MVPLSTRQTLNDLLGELKKFVSDCALIGGGLTKTELDLIFIRVNWDGPHGSSTAEEGTFAGGTARHVKYV